MFNVVGKYARRLVEASKSPEPVYAFASPQGIVEHLNATNNHREDFMPAQLKSSFELGNFQGRLRPVGNTLDAIDRKLGIRGSYGRIGSYPLEKVGVADRGMVGRIHVATNYTHFRGVEERFEDIKLVLEKPLKLICGEIPVLVEPGWIGLTMVREVDCPPRIERDGYTLISATTSLEPNVPECAQMFPNDIFLKEEWKTKKK